MIDTHAHLHGKEYEADLDEVLSRANDTGVERIVLIGVNAEDSERALYLARLHPDRLSVVAGVHPHDASRWNAEEKTRLEALLTDPQVVGLGEIGLDYHYDFSPREQQLKAFLEQLEIADRFQMPIVIHCREAYDELLQHLEARYGASPLPAGSAPRGVLHCYFGTLEQAHRAGELGFLIGVGGSCTFKKAEELHEVVRQVPLDQIVLETDAPYMAPVPYRGKRNESGHIPLIAARVAELKGIPVQVVAEATTRTARRLYRMQ